MSKGIAVRDLEGKVVFYLEGEVTKDSSGKVVGEPSSVRALKDDEKLALLGSVYMRDRGATPEGRQVLLDLAPSDVVTPPTVAEFGALADGCIADTVSEPVYVEHDRGGWYVENVSDVVKVTAPSESGSGSPAEVNPSFTQTGFITTEYALAAKLPRQTLGNADFNLKKRALRFVIEALRTRREMRLASVLTATATWTGTSPNVVTVAAGSKWNGGASADPLTDLFSALLLSAMPATHLILPENVAPYFFTSSRVRDFVQAGGKLPEILWARAKNTNNALASYIWGPTTTASGGAANTNVALVRISPEAGMLQTARTFRWLGKTSDGTRSEGILVRSFKDPSQDCEWIVGVYNDADVLIAPQVGALISGALQ